MSKGGHTFEWDPVGNNGTGFREFVKDGNDKLSDDQAKPSSNTKILFNFFLWEPAPTLRGLNSGGQSLKY